MEIETNLMDFIRAGKIIEKWLENRKIDLENFCKIYDIYIFNQLWGNTSTYNESFGGCAMTKDLTIVLKSKGKAKHHIVLFDFEKGYAVENIEDEGHRKFLEDLKNKNMAGVKTAKDRYK